MVDAMTYPNPNYHGPCPYCGSAISVVIKDGTTVARCSHRGCGARGPIMRSTERAVELFRAGRCVKVGSGAAEASEPSPPPTAPPLLEWGPDGPRLSEYERKRLEREAAKASGGEASDGPFGPVSDWLSKVPSIKRESLGTWRANDCAACEGSGYANARTAVAGARTCPACNGTGRKEGRDA